MDWPQTWTNRLEKRVRESFGRMTADGSVDGNEGEQQ